ncbi:16S rRNA (guanine(966)-N(2))-methyltransferase RsmD [Rhizohabitans arisaemae]|uniref:16S rRNA (guanine(966)-N(2))-methyltransferase RsmD n=1 Tax=Rhizohabitans arisaemae TaxID=2720610 RepID=UPI0024B0836D|nr:16S rRNA (guanine(966)-N(2))-methyltransferase RsmD [Rhizohabitans arisaemae]
MTRVIAGVAGGRRLSVPRGRNTRPTSDRAREGLFSSVGSSLGALDGVRVLDLYAGSGAVGIEALSRGAAHALLVESDPRAAQVIRSNVAAVGLAGAVVAVGRVERVLAQGCAEPYDLVFADPPYSVGDAEVVQVLGALREYGWLVDHALIAVERESRGADLIWPAGFEGERVRRYGEAAIWYGRAAGSH